MTEITEVRTINTYWTCKKCGKKFPPQMVRVHFEHFTNPEGKSDIRVSGFSCMKGCMK